MQPAPKGTLVLIGGSCTPQGEALGAFLSEGRALDGPIVGIPMASAKPRAGAKRWKGDFPSVGFPDVSFPPGNRKGGRADGGLAAQIGCSAGVFLGGGNQVKLVAELSG